MIAVNWDAQVNLAYGELRLARINGDALKIELAEAALNDLLERYPVTVVTGATDNHQEGKE